MLQVISPSETLDLIDREFSLYPVESELIPAIESAGRILSEDITASEFVPDFNRSTVDGIAVRAADTFGCSESIPAILHVRGEVLMGESPDFKISQYSCAHIPTGGGLPEGADCVVMTEYTEDYGDGTIGVLKAGAPGMNVIFRGDDVYPGKVIFKKGHVFNSHDAGTLSAIGISKVSVIKKLKVGIISTGDELVPVESVPAMGQIRDVNSPLLQSMLNEYGVLAKSYGIIKDDRDQLEDTLANAVNECDMVILSGGSSVGVRDAAAECIGEVGEILMHGIAIKPGKPTIIGRHGIKPVIGLPGHPAAACFIFKLFVIPLLDKLTGNKTSGRTITAVLAENISANHGRAQITACTLQRKDGGLMAVPVRSKSGIITQLSDTDGFIIIDRDCEGLEKGSEVEVYLYNEV